MQRQELLLSRAYGGANRARVNRASLALRGGEEMEAVTTLLGFIIAAVIAVIIGKDANSRGMNGPNAME